MNFMVKKLRMMIREGLQINVINRSRRLIRKNYISIDRDGSLIVKTKRVG